MRGSRMMSGRSSISLGSGALRGVDAERRRFIGLNKALAISFALLMLLLSANTALAWLSDEDMIANDMALGQIERPTYAAVVRADGGAETALMFGRGEPALDGLEVIDVFFDFIDNDASEDVPWKAHIEDVDTVIFKDLVRPANTAGWFEGADNLSRIISMDNLDMSSTQSARAMFKDCARLENVDISACGASSLSDMTSMFEGCSSLKALDLEGLGSGGLTGSAPQSEGTTFHIFEGCCRLESISISSGFAFTSPTSTYALQFPDPSLIPDADGHWYVDGADLAMTPESASEYVGSSIGGMVTLRAFGPGYAAVYGGAILVFGRGTPSDEYGNRTLVATYRGIETGDRDFNSNATSSFQNQPWRSYGLRSVESIASHKIPTPSIAYWFSNKPSITSIDLSSIDLSECTTMREAFYNCTGITRLDVSDWDVSNVKTLNSTFSQCSNLEHLDVSNWNLPKLGSSSGANGGPLSNTFASCEKLEVIDTSNWNVVTTDDFFRNANNSRRSFIVYCTNLKEIDLSGITITEGSATTSNRNWWTFTGCPNLEKLTVSSSFCTSNTDILSALKSNRYGYVNSNYWYEEGQGPALGGADVALRIQQLFDDEGSPEKTTFCSQRTFADEDTYAAYYVDPVAGNILVFGRGATVPETYGNGRLSNVYREIETCCGGSSKSSVPWNAVALFIKRVSIDTHIAPRNTGYWFYDFQNMTSIESLERLDVSDSVSAAYMFSYCASLEELDLSMWRFCSVTTLSNMFDRCQRLRILDVADWGLSDSLERDGLRYLFQSCFELTGVDLSSWTLDQGFAANQRYSFLGVFDDCYALRKVSFPHLGPRTLEVEGFEAMSAYGSGTFKNCRNLEEIIVPNDFNFTSAIIPAGRTIIDNIDNAGLWYEDRQGAAHTSEELSKALTARFRNGDADSHWYVRKDYACDDVYAAVYGDTIVFDRGERIPDTYHGKPFMSGYRELEHPSFIPGWIDHRNDNVTIVNATFDTEIHPKSLSRWFYRLAALKSIDGIEKLKTSGVTDFGEMFYRCIALRELDLSNFAIEATQSHDLSGMFSQCQSLVSLDLSRWNMPRWSHPGATHNIFNGCSNIEEIKVSPTFNFSDLDTSSSSGGVGFPSTSDPKEGFLVAACWYENGRGRPYAFFDAENVVNDRFDTKSEPTIWTRYPIEDAYAVVYEDMFTNEMSLVFARGALAEIQGRYPDKRVQGVALGFEHYGFNVMRSGSGIVPWSAYASDIEEVIVEDEVSVSDMQQWFEGFTNATAFDLAKLDTSRCTTLWKAFADCRAVEELDLSTWDTSSVLTYGGGGYDALFYNCSKLKKVDISNWDLSSIRDRSTMFAVCLALEEIDMSNCVYEDAPAMTYQCEDLQKVSISSNVSFAGNFFAPATPNDENGLDGRWYDGSTHEAFTPAQAKERVNARYLSGESPAVFIVGYGRSAYAAIYKATGSEDRKLVFGRGFADERIDDHSIELICRDLESAVYNPHGSSSSSAVVPWAEQRGNITAVINRVPSDDPIRPVSMNSWFSEMRAISDLDLSMFDVSKVVDMSFMLYGCTSLMNVSGLSGWDTSNVRYMDYALAGPKADFSSSISGWDTSALESMDWIFWNCKGLKELDISGWSTESLSSNKNSFYQCSDLVRLSLPRDFVKPSMSSIGQMFLECRSLGSIDASGWDTSGLIDMDRTFYNCVSLREIVGLEGWNVSSVSSMFETFKDCKVLEADCSKWNVASVVVHDGFSNGASSSFVQPVWEVASSDAVLEDGRSEDVEDGSKDEASFGLDEQSSGDSFVFDEDAMPLQGGGSKVVSYTKRAVKQLMFTVNLFTGEVYSKGFFR